MSAKVNITQREIEAAQFQKFKSDFEEYANQQEDDRFQLAWDECKPFFDDATDICSYDQQYVYHPAWAARILAKTKPSKHTDISSTIYFSSMLSAFISVDYYEYRPLTIFLDNLTSGTADLLALPFSDNSIESLSCMHTVEHVGLGRYGDPIDANGDLKAMTELKRVLKPGGNFLLVVPIGRAKIEFNAHRIYSYRQIRDYFANLTFVQYDLIPDNATEVGIIYNATREQSNEQENGCGCFWWTK